MIKIGIVDDHVIVRTALRQFFAEHVDLRVVGEAGNGQGALDMLETTEVDVMVMDLQMPGRSGFEAVSAVREKAPDTGILILSGYPEEQHATNLVRLGISGYLNKECTPLEIVEAVRVVALGRRVLSQAVKDMLAKQEGRKIDGPSHELLSRRELEVFIRLAKGEKLGEVAKALALSVKTASTYRNRILGKLDMATNSQMTFYAYANKLID